MATPDRIVETPQGKQRSGGKVFASILRVGLAILLIAITFFVLYQGFLFLRAGNAPKWVIAIVAIVWGVGGVAILYFLFNWLVEQFSLEWTARLQPFVFVGPAIVMLIWFLALPVLRTCISACSGVMGRRRCPSAMLFTDPGQYFAGLSGQFVGLDNYVAVFTDRLMLGALRNNILFWIGIATPLTVISGLLIAVLADRSKLGAHRQVPDLHAHGHFVRRRQRDLELHLRGQPSRHPSDRPAQCGRGGSWRATARLDQLHCYCSLE